MKEKKGFMLHEVCEKKILVAEGKENIDFEDLITLNDSAAFLWTAMADREFTIDDMAQALIGEYAVSAAEATADSAALVEAWRKAGVIED